MLKNFYKNKRFEEIMGLTGVLYLVILCLAAALLVQFLVNITLWSLVPSSIAGSAIPQYSTAAAKNL